MTRGAPASISALFDTDSERSQAFHVQAADLIVDYSRQCIDRDTRDDLIEAAIGCEVETGLKLMFTGARINRSEDRSVGHVALRMSESDVFEVGGRNVVPDVLNSKLEMFEFARGVRTGEITGESGSRFTTVVNIGIGGSDLGPRFLYDALEPTSTSGRIECRYVSNVDPRDLEHHLEGLEPRQTLFIVSSKSFTTTETLLNARTAIEWIRRHLGDRAISHHVVAITANISAVADLDTSISRIFPMWNWVGGRYSISSAVSLSVVIAHGVDSFEQFLAGMRAMDRHVLQSKGSSNAALMLALVGIWNRQVLGAASRAILPYSFDLRHLPAFLQQMVMESNGKSVRHDGQPVAMPTSPVIWGDVGTNAQHAFMQFLHQGTDIVPVDFIGFAKTAPGDTRIQGRALFMNMVAQSRALAFGGVVERDAPHRQFPGNRPNTVIVAAELSAATVGQIVALYEHATFFEGWLLGINSFDQWGVELGKSIAEHMIVESTRVEEAHSTGEFLVDWFNSVSRRH